MKNQMFSKLSIVLLAQSGLSKLAIFNCALAMVALVASILAMQPVSAKDVDSQQSSKNSKSKKSPKYCKKDQKAMKITLTKSGGFAGMNLVYDVDSTKLSEEQGKKLSELFTASKILDLKSKTTAGAADLFFYEFKIDDGKKTTSVHFDDMSLPESVRPLLSFLMEVTPGVNNR